MDLKIAKSKRSLIVRALLSAFSIIILSTAGIAGLFKLVFSASWQACIANAIPLSVISSAITIPSIGRIDPSRREFLTYESTFSDILGVLLFNFAVSDKPITLAYGGLFLLETIGLVIASALAVMLLIMLLRKKGKDAKFFLVIAALTFAYGVGKLIHLSTLILVMIFGLVLGNIPSTLPGRLGKLLKPEALVEEVPVIHRFVKELAFFIRTFFFLAFGLSIRLESLANIEVLSLGAGIIVLIFVIRLVFLKLLRIGAGATEILVSPRGLVTVLLVFAVPRALKLPLIYEDVVYAVILISGIVMTIGLLLTKNTSDLEKFD
jgi:Kef-type K+ transport system membrane component KefB